MSETEIREVIKANLKIRVAEVSLDPITKLLTHLNGERIALDRTAQFVLRTSARLFREMMRDEPGRTFLFEWNGEWNGSLMDERIPPYIAVEGVSLTGWTYPELFTKIEGEVIKVGFCQILMNTKERKIVFAHISNEGFEKTRAASR